jgi:hypothetical protein
MVMAALTQGQSRGKARAVAVLVVLAVLLVLAAKISPVVNPPKWDECIYVYDAQRVLSGQVPYRDFFQFTPPGDLFLLAGWFRLFVGHASLTWGRYLSALAALVSWLWLARSLRRAGWTRQTALAAGSLYPLLLYTFWPVPSHHWFAGLCVLGSFEAYDFERGSIRDRIGWLWLGLSWGLAFLFLQTAAAGLAALWGVFWLLGPRGRGKARSVLWSSAGAAVVVGPVLGWFWSRGALEDLFRDVFVWTAGHYRIAAGPNAVPLLQDLPARLAALWQAPKGTPAWLWVPLSSAGTLVYAGILAAVGGVAFLSFRSLAQIVRERRFPAPLTSAVLFLTVVEGSLFLMGKPDWLHLVYTMGRIGPPWLFLWAPVIRSSRSWRAAEGWTLGLLVSGGVALGAGWMLFQPPALWQFTEVGRPVREAPVNRYLRAQPWLLPGDTIAAFPEGGEVYLYVRPAAVGYTLLYPPNERYYGRKDYEIVARQILKNKPRCIVMTSDTAAWYLAPDCPLASVIREHYRPFSAVGGTVIFREERSR